MVAFFRLLADFFGDIIRLFNSTIISAGPGSNLTTTLGGLLFACIILGFAVNIFWKGARS